MTKPFQPLLAATAEDLSAIRYPVLASPKLDGIRCVIRDGKALTRKLKPVPNNFIREWCESHLPSGLDGELMLRDHRTTFNDVSSAIMSRDGEPDFVFMAFDFEGINLDEEGTSHDFADRIEFVHSLVKPTLSGRTLKLAERLIPVPHAPIKTAEELRALIEVHLEQGYEGTMVRDPKGIYKFGRSTVKEGILLKIKPWFDEEAEVIDVVEQMHNTNEATLDERGYAKRSSAKAGKIGTGKMGTLVCLTTEDGIDFEIGTGFTDAQRKAIWDDWILNEGSKILGAQVKFKHLGRFPDTKRPRGPVFLGWRKD